jgi:hypothetical protein
VTPSSGASAPPGATARSALIGILLLVVLFLGSGVAGVQLAQTVAPESFIAAFIGLFALPLAFASGLQLWLGLALFGALWQLLRRALGGARARASFSEPRSANRAPPGSFVFVPLSAAFGTLAGLVIGVTATTIGFFATAGIYAGLGLVHGVACWLAARSGHLPLPEHF